MTPAQEAARARLAASHPEVLAMIDARSASPAAAAEERAESRHDAGAYHRPGLAEAEIARNEAMRRARGLPVGSAATSDIRPGLIASDPEGFEPPRYSNGKVVAGWRAHADEYRTEAGFAAADPEVQQAETQEHVGAMVRQEAEMDRLIHDSNRK